MRLRATLLLVLTACGHSDAFVGADPETYDIPFATGQPVRLTYDAGMDLFPSWSPDGRTLAYSFQPKGLADFDRCLGIMATGAGTRRDVCYADFDGTDRTDALEWPAIGPDAQLLFTQHFSDVETRFPAGGTLRLGTVDAPLPGRVLLTIPTTIGPIGFNSIGTTRWASASRFYFVPQSGLSRGSHANPNKKDTIFVGVGIVRGDLTNGAPTFTFMAGTDSASGFDFLRSGDSIYFTRQHDFRLYAMPVSGGPATVVYTADVPGGEWMLRNPTRIGNRIAVVLAAWDIVTGPGGVPPRGLIPGTRIELVRPNIAGSEVAYTPPAGSGLGVIAAPPNRCEIVFEARRAQQISFTTDLYSLCVGSGNGCACP